MSAEEKNGSGWEGNEGGITRRRLIGLGVAAAAGGAIVVGAVGDWGGGGAGAGGRKLEISEECLGCTGCVVVCPEAALSLEPGCRVTVADDRCTRCGYCVAVCPVDALRVTREVGHG